MEGLQMKTTKSTNSLSPQIIIFLVSLFVLSVIALFSGAAQPSFASARAQNTSASSNGQAQSYKLGQPTTPLEKLLNKDGTLNLDTGFTGSLDATGWQLSTGPNGQPHFVHTNTNEARSEQLKAQTQNSKLKTQNSYAPLVPGDENWDDRFYL